MYKLLIFLKKTDDDEIINHFENVIASLASKVTEEKIQVGKVESNLLLEEKYSRLIELTSESKEILDKKFNTKEGKSLNKVLMSFQNNISIITINYN